MKRILGAASSLVARGGKPLRFLIVGGLNTALGLTIYPLMLWTVPWLHVHYMVALLIAQAVATLFAFMTYKLLVFQTQGRTGRELVRFLAFYLANYAVNWAALPFLVEVAHLPPIIAQVGFTVTIAVLSWFWHNRVTFGSHESPSAASDV
jgi:putative flippase GtrA